MADDVKIKFTSNAQQPIDDVLRLQKQIVRLEQTVGGLKDKLKAGQGSMSDLAKTGDSLGGSLDASFGRLATKLVGVHALMRIVNHEMQHARQIGLDAAKAIGDAFQTENKLIQGTVGVPKPVLDEAKKGIDDLIKSGRAPRGVSRADLTAAAIPLTNAAIGQKERERGIELAAKTFQGDQGSIRAFAEVIATLTKRLHMSADDAAGFGLKLNAAGVGLGGMNNAIEQVIDDQKKNIGRIMPLSTASQRLEEMYKRPGYQRLQHEGMSGDAQKVVEAFFPQTALNRQELELVKKYAQDPLFSKLIHFRPKSRSQALGEQLQKQEENAFPNLGPQAETTEDILNGSTIRARTETLFRRVDEVNDAIGNTATGGYLRNFARGMNRFGTWMRGDFSVTTTPWWNSAEQQRHLDEMQAKFNFNGAFGLGSPFGQAQDVAEQALKAGKSGLASDVARRANELLEQLVKQGIGQQEEQEKQREWIQDILKRAGAAQNVNTNVESRKDGG